MLPSIVERVTTRYKAAAMGKWLPWLLNTLVKKSGGVPLIAKAIDRDLPSWDKDEFYRRDFADSLLWRLLNEVRQEALYGALTKVLDAAKPSYQEGGIDDQAHAEIEWEGNGILTIEFTAYGPDFARYSEDSDDDWTEYVEVPEDEAHLDDSLRNMAKLLGADHPWFPKDREESFNPNYDYYEYHCKFKIRVDPEALIRQSIGKLVDQAGQSIPVSEWEGEAPTARIELADHSEVTVTGRWGTKEFYKGERLEVIRGGREGSKIKVRDKHREIHYFRLSVDKKGLVLLRDDKKLWVTLS